MILLHHNIDAFLAVVDHSTISLAAKNIGLTQTAVTQRIKSLERDFGVTLFLRSRKGMTLTDEGKNLYRHCISIKETEGRLLSGLKAGSEQQNIELCMTGPATVLRGRIGMQYQKLAKKWPQLNLHLIDDVSRVRLEMLKKGVADLAILVDGQIGAELDSKPLTPWEFAMIVPYSWRHRKVHKIVETEKHFAYRESDGIGEVYLKNFGLDQYLNKKPIIVNDSQTILGLIKQEIGYGFLPLEVVSYYAKSKDVTILNPKNTLKIPISLAWYPRPEAPDYFTDVINAIN